MKERNQPEIQREPERARESKRTRERASLENDIFGKDYFCFYLTPHFFLL